MHQQFFIFFRQLSSNTESTTAFESTLASTKDVDFATDSCTTCSTNALTDSTIASTEDPSSTDSSTISSPEWTTELMLDNENDENENTEKNGNKNAKENEDKTTKAEEKTDISEKNKTTTNSFAIPTDVGNALVPDETLSENSTLIKVTIRGRKMIKTFIKKWWISVGYFSDFYKLELFCRYKFISNIYVISTLNVANCPNIFKIITRLS